MGTSEKSANVREIEELVRARCPIIYIVSPDEARVEAALRGVAQERETRLEAWSITEGFRVLLGTENRREVFDPLKAIEYTLVSESGIFILRDFHAALRDPKVVRRLRDAADLLPKTKKTVIVLSPLMVMPAELDTEVVIVAWDPPSAEEILAVARSFAQNLPEATREQLEKPDVREQIVAAVAGLTAREIALVISITIVRTKGLDPGTIKDERDKVLKKRARLEALRAPASR
jgi:hypothetical protein